MLYPIPRIVPAALVLPVLFGASAWAQSGVPTPVGPAQGTPAQPLQWEDISPIWLQGTSPMRVTFQPGSPERILLGTAFEGLLNSEDHGRKVCIQALCLGSESSPIRCSGSQKTPGMSLRSTNSKVPDASAQLPCSRNPSTRTGIPLWMISASGGWNA